MSEPRASASSKPQYATHASGFRQAYGLAFMTLAGAAGGLLLISLAGPYATPRTESSAPRTPISSTLTQALLLPPVATAERAQALTSLRIPEVQRVNLERAASPLIWLTLWDDQAEDGDQVAVESDGVWQVVGLTHRQQRIALPRPASGWIHLHGLRDGGGGITVAVATLRGRLDLPRLTPGQVLPVLVQ